MDEAEYCDRISIMSDGRIVALDTPSELKRNYDAGSVEDVFVKIARPGMKYSHKTADINGLG
jgi:ABC-2 type transport system ATP-binding protein